MGMLMKRNMAVMARGPAIVHHHDGAAARLNSQRPHQNSTSPK
jgi:hypothetical protein